MANAAPIEQLAEKFEGIYHTGHPLFRQRERVADRFQIAGELGRGGQAVVYDAYDEQTQQYVGLKFPILNSASSIGRAVREIAVTEALSSRTDDVVPYVDCGSASQHAPRLWIATKKMPNSTLKNQIAGHNKQGDLMALEDILRVMTPAARAIHFMHQEEHLVHRDIKPENIFVDQDGSGKLGDFGIVAAENYEPEFFETQHLSPYVMLESLTQTESMVGVFANNPPEILFEEQGFTKASDTFMVGATAHQALTGKKHTPESGSAAAYMHVMEDYQPPSLDSYDEQRVPPALAKMVIASLERHPQNRPQMSEVVTTLEEVAANRVLQPA